MRVLAALSGGVDSAVAAALLVEEGHEVVGATMRLWGGDSDTGCCSVADVEDARRCAAQLGIDHHVFNLSEEFESAVVAPYVDAHRNGRTPNPCVECNRHLKFDAFIRRAELLGFDAVATGHHARVVACADGLRVGRGADAGKDQSYVLYPLRADVLERVLLPIGSLTKTEVRARARALGLRSAAKPDSQDVCFVTRAEGRAGFLSGRMEMHPGVVLDVAGEQVGATAAVELVTVGQRRGLELAGGGARRYVLDLDVGSRTVTVGSDQELLVGSEQLEQVVWAGAPVHGPVWAQCSAHGLARPAEVVPGGDVGAEVIWSEPRARVAPGQSVVLYEGDLVVGGGHCRGRFPMKVSRG